MKKGRSIMSLIIIICLSISSLICSKGILEDMISRKVNLWSQEQPRLFTSQLTDEQQSELLSTLQDFSNSHNFIFISQNETHEQSGTSLYTFSIFSSPDVDGISFDPLVILGTPVVDKMLVQEVATSEVDSYAGYGNDTFKRITNLPSIRSSTYFRIDMLGAESNFGSSCKVLGLNQDEFQELLAGIASSTGMSEEDLTTQMSGTAQVSGLLYVFSGGAFVILSVVFCLLMVTYALLELRTLGVYLMLGWSKRDFFCKLFSTQALQLLAVIPIGALGSQAVLDGFTPNLKVFGYACTTMLPTILVVSISVGIASLSFAFVKPTDAISNRYSRRGFYILTAVVYLACLLTVFGGCLYVDQPLEMYENITHTRSSWNKYASWSVLQDFRLNNAMFTGNPMSLSEDMYAWYADNEHAEGVFLAHTNYYSSETIKAYLPDNTSPEAFWYLAASPSYLKQIGVELSATDIAKAESGVRVYLLPESMDLSQTNKMEQFLRASSKPFDSNITTEFMENPSYEFSVYDGTQQLFTWSTNTEQPATADNFVIAVITANNMIPFESESLVATGLENNYVKLNEQGAFELLDNAGAASLSENSLGVRFATVSNYIDGLQKTLEELFMLFSAVLFMMIATIAVMIICLITIVNRTNAREIGVKYALGFSTWAMYKKEILFVDLATLGGILTCAALKSSAGVLVGTALLVISNFVIFGIVRRKSAAVMLETISKEQ
jgi:hypothetical protein